MVIRSDKIGQSWLLPLAVSELIPEDVVIAAEIKIKRWRPGIAKAMRVVNFFY